jgi:hypothetical protein
MSNAIATLAKHITELIHRVNELDEHISIMTKRLDNLAEYMVRKC